MKISQSLNQLAEKIGVDNAFDAADFVLSPASVYESIHDCQQEAFNKGLALLDAVKSDLNNGGSGDVYEIPVRWKSEMSGVRTYRCFYIGTEQQITERLNQKLPEQTIELDDSET